MTLAGGATGLILVAAGVVWLKRFAARQEPLLTTLRAQTGDLARLPGRLHRVAADPRTPRRARWLLVGLALYVASPIDPIPDFLPVVVPLVLVRVRRLIPPEVWAEHFPERAAGRPR